MLSISETHGSENNKVTASLFAVSELSVGEKKQLDIWEHWVNYHVEYILYFLFCCFLLFSGLFPSKNNSCQCWYQTLQILVVNQLLVELVKRRPSVNTHWDRWLKAMLAFRLEINGYNCCLDMYHKFLIVAMPFGHNSLCKREGRRQIWYLGYVVF